MLLLPPERVTQLAPAELLALEEGMLDQCEENPVSGLITFWCSKTYFVVLGYGKKLADEVFEGECARLDVPILRRCSGGGTVLQGPGCLNYTLVLPIESKPELATISGTNRYIMGRVQRAIEPLLAGPVSVEGCTDLVLDRLKFAGNAQRRKRHFLLFHGSLLLNFDLEMIAKTLRLPQQQPEYRSRRAHLDFLRNIGVDATAIQAALLREWKSTGEANSEELEDILRRARKLAAEKYSRDDWNRRF